MISKKNLIDIVAVFACVMFIVVGSIVSLHRYWQYDVTFIDFGQYDQAIWKIAHFQAPIIDHFVHGRINVLGDHVTPSIFLIAPAYWITERSEVLLIIQAFAVGLSGFFLYDIAKTLLKKRFLSLSVLASYFLFTGLQNAVISEFHELTVMTLPLMISLWAIIKNKVSLYFIALIIMLGFKEITFSLGIGIGIALILLKKDWRRYGLITIIISIIWGLIAFKFILPMLSGGRYLYASEFPNSPLGFLTAMFDEHLKRRTLWYSFQSFSFLPFLAPQFWFAMIQDYASRFLPLHFVTRWDLGLHYNAQSAVLLSVSSVFGLRFLFKLKKVKKYSNILAILIIINAIFLFRFVLNGPFLLAVNPVFYKHTADFKFLDNIVGKIPKDASVMTHNNLAPRFSHQDVALLTKEYKTRRPEYILIDRRGGQSANNFLGSKNIDEIFKSVKADSGYEVYFKTSEQYIFKRK